MSDPAHIVEELVEHHKLVRRLALLWAMVLITVVVIRVTEPSVIVAIGAGGATIVTAVIGLLATVIGLYQHHRNGDDLRAQAPAPDQWPPRRHRAYGGFPPEEEHW